MTQPVVGRAQWPQGDDNEHHTPDHKEMTTTITKRQTNRRKWEHGGNALHVRPSARKYEGEGTRESPMEQFNQVLGLSSGEKRDGIEWIREAARATILEPETMEYPKRPKARRHYTSGDWRTHKHLQALRSMRVQVLTDAIGHIRTSERVMQRTKRKVSHCTFVQIIFIE